MVDKNDIQPGERLLFIGDSITDCERLERARPLGFGYVQMVAALVRAHRPELDFEVINRGISGDTIVDLERRWTKDVLEERPDRLFVMIGVNDVVNRYQEEHLERAVDDERYRATYRRLLRLTTDEFGCRIVLLEPTCLDLPPDLEPSRDLATLARIVGELGDELDHPVLPVFQRLAPLIGTGRTQGWYSDHTHPWFTGHAFVALLILEHLGFRLTEG